MTLLLLIRHAVTDQTGKRLLGWTPGVHLSERGKEQARGLPERLQDVPLAAIYTSPLERCRETAAPLAASRRLRPAVRADLGEVRYGDWTGRPLKQLARTKLWRTVHHVPSQVRFPGGESLLETQERAVREVGRIAAAHPNDTVAAVSHGDAIRLVLAHFSGMHIDLFQRLVVDPTSISAVALGTGPPTILRVNDTGGLGELVRGKPPRRKVGG